MVTPYTTQLAALESSGGRRMFNGLGSGATGKYQFMPDTWADLIRRFPNAGLTPAGITDNAPGGQQDIALQLFNQSNNAVLKRSLGRDPQPWETYAAHRFGSGGAQDLFGSADDMPARLIFPQKWIEQNPDIADKTAGEIKTLFQGRFGATPPVEVAARPPAQPVQETPAMPQSTPGLLFDAPDTTSSSAAPPQQPSTADAGMGWLGALAAGLMEFGSGLRGGAPGAGMNMVAGFQKQAQQQASQQALAAAMQKMNGPNPDMKGALAVLGANPATAAMAFQMMPEMEKMRQKQALVQTANTYADRLDASGHKDLAVALRGNPALMEEVVKHQATAAFPKQEAFTLAPGNVRYGADGKVVASAPDAPDNDLVTVFDPTTGQSTYHRKSEADGLTAPPPRGVTVNLNNGQDTVAQRQALAESLGVPLAGASPYDNANLSAKGRENLFLANQKAAEKRWASLAEEDAAHRKAITTLERFKELNGKVGTGGLMGMPGVGAAAGLFDSDVAEMRSITAEIAPNMRAPGSGATSDFDAKQFERATVGIDKPKQANENIANARIAAAQMALERGAFERAYFDANGHLQGADRAWRQYVEANPIFDPKGKDFALNPSRTAWKDFFRPKKEQAAPSSGVPGAELDFDPATGTFTPRAR